MFDPKIKNQIRKSPSTFKPSRWAFFISSAALIIGLSSLCLAQDPSSSPGPASVTDGASDKPNRMEEILVWKISEDLKLSTKDEKKVSDLIRALNQEKSDRAQSIESLQKKMSAEVSPTDAKELLKLYKKELSAYNDLSIEEIARVQKILSPQQTVRYFSVKAGLSQKIRAILGYNSRTDHKAKNEAAPAEKAEHLPEPKIIEDP